MSNVMNNIRLPKYIFSCAKIVISQYNHFKHSFQITVKYGFLLSLDSVNGYLRFSYPKSRTLILELPSKLGL